MVIDNSGFLVMYLSFVEFKGFYFEDWLFYIMYFVSMLNFMFLLIKYVFL